MWIVFATSAGAILGCGDVLLKLLSRKLKPIVACLALYFLGLILWVPFLSLTGRSQIFLQSAHLPAEVHLLILGRSLLQLFAYAPIFFALRTLSLSTYSALRAVSPVLALVAGIVIYGDRPSVAECIGICAVLLGIAIVSRVDYLRTLRGNVESRDNQPHALSYVLVLVAATCSALMPTYDKYLLTTAHTDGFVLQALSDLYRMVLLLTILPLVGQHGTRHPWRLNWPASNASWQLIAAASLIAAGEMLSFYSISLPGSLPSIVAILRRTSLPVSAIFGRLVFGETFGVSKIAGIVAVAIGIILINGT